jgi:hypothetical protein
MSDGIIRRALFAGTALTIIGAAGAVPAHAESSAESLAAVLANKGVISQSEARSISAAPASAQQGRLVSILRKKGVLADDDLKTLRPETRPEARPLEVAKPDPSTAMAADIPHAAEPMYKKAAVTVGGFEITPVGYIALTTVTRSTNVGGISTSFNSIPFDNTIQGNIPETRLTGQNTRIGLRAHSHVNSWLDVVGYLETDFNGNDPANVFVSTNSHTNRLRLAYADINAGDLEFTAGQAWSWMTPNRKGLGPDPRTVFTTLNVDPGIQVGLPFAREGAVRVAWHPTKEFAIGVGAENPDQYVGAGEVIFPFAFNAQLGPQFDANNQTTVPNRYPDLVGKATFDTDFMDRHMHFETVAMWRSFNAIDLPTGAGTFVNHSTTGWAVEGSANIEVWKGLNLFAGASLSEGGGRYLGGLGPDVVVMPIQTGAATFDLQLSAVKSYSYLLGAEWQVTDTTQIAGYYGSDFFQNNFFPDVTSPLAVKPFIGFGGPNSPNTANKEIHEWTADLKHTFWTDPRLGAILTILQYSYVQREPWFVALGAPTQANTHMFFTEFRYVFPGT